MKERCAGDLHILDFEQLGRLHQSVAHNVIIIGGGPAGLTAAFALMKRSQAHHPVVCEASGLLGGIARTESHNGYRFDIGGHRFFTKVAEVSAMWDEIMGEELITVSRKSRIFYRGRFFDYPLRLFNALVNVGVYESVRIVASYLKWRVRPHKVEDSFEEWVINRFGGCLYMHFFRSYTEKVWGIPGSQIRADWVAQRINNLSLVKALWNAISGKNETASLIKEFKYPRLGPGQMWELCAKMIVDMGGDVRMDRKVVRLHHDGVRVTAVDLEAPDRAVTRLVAPHVISTMSLSELIPAFDPPTPVTVREAAQRLNYRDFLIVTLILAKADPFPDNWIYVHAPTVRVGRIQNFRAWSKDMVPDPATASIGMEYFCQEGDDLWVMADGALRELATSELVALGLAEAHDVIDAAAIRQPKAYPVYDSGYKQALDSIAKWLGGLENFQTVGRNGQHRYNNQDHSMLTAMYAVRNILGEDLDVWNVNVERSYHEELEPERPDLAFDRAAPTAELSRLNTAV